MKEIVMPKLGLTMTEGTVSKWLKAEGDTVKEGEPLFEVETDKLTNTIEASASEVARREYRTPFKFCAPEVLQNPAGTRPS